MVHSINEEIVLKSSWIEARDEFKRQISTWAEGLVHEHPYMRAALLELLGPAYASVLQQPGEADPSVILREPHVDQRTADHLRKQAREKVLAQLPACPEFALDISAEYQTAIEGLLKSKSIDAPQTLISGSNLTEQHDEHNRLVADCRDQSDSVANLLLAVTNMDGFVHIANRGFQSSFFKTLFLPEFQGNPSYRQPELMESLWASMVGKCLPSVLRRSLWHSALYCRQAHKGCVETLVERASSMNIEDTTKTAFDELISKGVQRTIRQAFPGLCHSKVDKLQLRMNQLLNQYYILSGRHSSRNISLAFPLVWVFEDVELEDGELLAMFDQLIHSYIPDILDSQILEHFETEVLKDLSERDEELFTHCTVVFPEKENESQVGKLSANELRCSHHISHWFLNDLGVGFLRPESLLFVWDHLFLLGWREQLPQFLVDILILMRTGLLGAKQQLTCHEINDTIASMVINFKHIILTQSIRQEFLKRYPIGNMKMIMNYDAMHTSISSTNAKPASAFGLLRRVSTNPSSST